MDTAQSITLTLASVGTHAAQTLESASGPPTRTPVVSTPEPSPTFGIPPSMTRVFSAGPGEPRLSQGFVIDYSSAALADEHHAIADNFQANILERPFTREAMGYQPYLDVIRGEISLEDGWIYVSITLQDSPPPGAAVGYAVEFDLGLEGRGEWLIVTDPPASEQWSNLGVRAYHDGNGDVGGAHPMTADPPPQVGDGYENLVVEDGRGPEADAAWARRVLGHASRIQIAIRHDLVGGDERFLWSIWADGGPQQPRWFDYHDHFALEGAGSALANSRYYPLLELASVDNTCRWAFGFTPTGSEPGICRFERPTPAPSRTPTATPMH
ncbi:MAG: hypothetical protein WD906_09610 [Anaerolineales bacterium]